MFEEKLKGFLAEQQELKKQIAHVMSLTVRPYDTEEKILHDITGFDLTDSICLGMTKAEACVYVETREDTYIEQTDYNYCLPIYYFGIISDTTIKEDWRSRKASQVRIGEVLDNEIKTKKDQTKEEMERAEYERLKAKFENRYQEYTYVQIQ